MVLDYRLRVAVIVAMFAVEKVALLMLVSLVGSETGRCGYRIPTEITLVGFDFFVMVIYVRFQLRRFTETFLTFCTFMRFNSLVFDFNMSLQCLWLGSGIWTLGAFVRLQTLMNVVNVIAKLMFSVCREITIGTFMRTLY